MTKETRVINLKWVKNKNLSPIWEIELFDIDTGESIGDFGAQMKEPVRAKYCKSFLQWSQIQRLSTCNNKEAFLCSL